jgi:DNA-binding LytR/AlgR family response regulator
MAPAPRTLIVKSGYRQIVIPLGEIVFIEARRDYILIHRADGSGVVKTLMTLGAVETMLPPDGFVRVHRGYIVALDRIRGLKRSRVTLDGGHSIPLSDTCRPSFLAALSSRTL